MIGMKLKSALIAASATLCLASGADAQRLNLGFTKQLGRKSAISVGLQVGQTPRHNYGGTPPIVKPGYAPACQPVAQTIWVPGRYETVRQRVWVPGRTEQIWVEPVYATHYDPCGNPYQVLVSAGHYRTVTHPGCYEVRPVQVWRPGHYKTVYR